VGCRFLKDGCFSLGFPRATQERAFFYTAGSQIFGKTKLPSAKFSRKSSFPQRSLRLGPQDPRFALFEWRKGKSPPFEILFFKYIKIANLCGDSHKPVSGFKGPLLTLLMGDFAQSCLERFGEKTCGNGESILLPFQSEGLIPEWRPLPPQIPK